MVLKSWFFENKVQQHWHSANEFEEKTRNWFFGQTSDYDGSQSGSKKKPTFETISAECSYIQCKLTNHFKKVDPKVSKNAKVDPKVSKNAKVKDVLWIFLPPSSIESRSSLLVSMLVACRSSMLWHMWHNEERSLGRGLSSPLLTPFFHQLFRAIFKTLGISNMNWKTLS